MLSFINKIIASILSIIMFWGAVLGICSPPINSAAYSELEKNYVYSWNSSDSDGKSKILNMQTERYALQTDGHTGTIVSMGAYKSKVEGIYTDADFSSLLQISGMVYTVDDGKEQKLTQKDRWHRLIESGKYVSRTEYNELASLSCGYVGRMEVSATQQYFSIIYEVYNDKVTSVPAKLSWSLTFSEDLTAEYTPDGRAVTLKTADGYGLTFIKSRAAADAQFVFSGKTLQVSCSAALDPGKYSGFGVFVTASNTASISDAQVLYDIENAQVSATAVNPSCGELPVAYDEQRGIHTVDISAVSVGGRSDSTNYDEYERVLFTVKNNSERKICLPVTFEKRKGALFSITGMSPVIRDPATLEPTGIQVQISKNWHSYGKDVAENAYKRNNEGPWYRGSTAITAEANGTAEYEYTCAYGRWGGVYATSHAQLGLIGYTDTACLRWDQAALGSWGESVTYDPDKGLMRSRIDDVRPFLVTSPISGYSQYNWTGNVGGADFLCYTGLLGKKVSLSEQKVIYRAQAPNMTDVVYSGFTADGKIKFDITVNMGRTDDVVRVYYTLAYTFMEDTYFSNLAFFKLCAENYSDNTYTRYAYGDANGAYATGNTLVDMSCKYLREHKRLAASGNDFWFSLYAATDDEENADSVMIIREYSADINGAHYNMPSYTICDTGDGDMRQPGCEISVPKGAGAKVAAGSSVQMTVEHLVLPAVIDDYYGESGYLNTPEYAAIAGTWKASYKQVTSGAVSCNASIGTVVSDYPLEIKSEAGEIPAQFSLTGGLGYTAVRISGLESYAGYMLQAKSGSAWVNVTQSGNKDNANDFWQTQFDSRTGTYSRTYNLENSPSGSAETHEYRLIQMSLPNGAD